MTLHRHANRRDANEPEVVAYLKAHGYSCFRADVPCDLLVGKGLQCHLLEVKVPDAPKRAGLGLTDAQARFRRTWRGCFHIVHDGPEAVELLRECERLAGMRGL